MTTIDWWVDAGPDTCEFCWRAFYAEIGYYCFNCDRGICPGCAVTVFERRVVLCPQCGTEGAG